MLDSGGADWHTELMNDSVLPLAEMDDDAAEAEALKAAIAKARADKREVPHEEMRAWLLKSAEGDFSPPPPVPRLL